MATMGGSLSSSSGTSSMLVATSSYNITEHIGKLKETRKWMLATLADAEEMVIWKESVKLWLRELRGLAYDAEDLIEEYEYEVHHHQVCGSDFSSTDAAAMGFQHKIESVEERFCTLAKERESLGLDGDKVHKSTPWDCRPTGSFLTEPRVYGREGDKERVLESLLSDVTMENGIPVVSIVGMGGLGKTTLAQLIYKEVRDGFDRSAWVHVSEDYDVTKLSLSIIKGFKEPCQLTELSVLQEEMAAAVRDKIVLLVLDDLWSSDPDLYDKLLAPLRDSKPGSKVLVTTRSERVGKGMNNLIASHRLGLLSDDDCWSLFQQHAFSGRDDQRHLLLLNMEEVRTKVAEKCKGLPLAAKTLGGLLRYEGDGRRWMHVLGSDFRELDGDGGEYSGITWVLKLSYIHLPAHLKPCFACCSVFPKGYEISKDELVYMWMAHGLVPAFDVGMEYIKELLWRSLLQIPRYQSEEEEKTIMHDLIHDLAHDILEGERPKEERSAKHPRYKKETLMAHDCVFIQQPSIRVNTWDFKKELSDRRNFGAHRFVQAPDSLAPLLDHFEPRVYGREGDKERVLESLLSDVSMENGIPVVCIVGMGGIGKTTLAQLLCEEVGGEFDIKAWIHVSEDYDVRSLGLSIIYGPMYRSLLTETELSVTQDEMIATVRNNIVLLVLDDVWSFGPDLCDKWLAPLGNSAPGSKVLVTTRSEGVGKGMKNLIASHRLELLSDDDCWSLFQHHAFSGRDDQRHLVLRNMEEVRTKVAEKCKGLPLAAKTLGGLLRYEGDERRWMYVLGSDLRELGRDGGEYSGVMGVLKLSYIHLPAHLKPCFACCSLFPKGYEISTEELVAMWKVHDLVSASDYPVSASDVEKEYIEELVWRSLLQLTPDGMIVMHDLIHDLAHEILEGGRPQEELLCMAHGRVFIQQPSCVVDTRSLERMFSDRRNLRALGFFRTGIRKLPESVGDLKHMRYIELRGCYSLESLPESVCKLYNLQFLCLPPNVAELPQNFKNLTNLQHLVVENEQLMFPSGFGRLTKLQHLSFFNVNEREKYASIGELKQLTNLRGRLKIEGLRNRVSPEKAYSACLGNKEHLNSLKLKWDGYRKHWIWEPVDDAEVAEVWEALRPHDNLSKLEIFSHPGTRLPSWLGHPSFRNMSFLKLGCCSCRDLPALGELPNLRELMVWNLASVKHVGPEFYRSNQSIRNYEQCFPSLRRLSISRMEGLEDWASCGCRFTELRKLKIESCCRLMKIQCDFANLTELDLVACPKLDALPKMPLIRELNLGYRYDRRFFLSEELQSLEVLSLLEIDIESLPLYKLPALEHLTIRNSNSLERLEFTPHSHALRCFSSVLPSQQFDHASTSTISATSSCNLISSLKSMELTSCRNLDFSTEDQLHTTLKEIKVKRCPKLKDWCNAHRDTMLAHVKEVYLEDD